MPQRTMNRRTYDRTSQPISLSLSLYLGFFHSLSVLSSSYQRQSKPGNLVIAFRLYTRPGTYNIIHALQGTTPTMPFTYIWQHKNPCHNVRGNGMYVLLKCSNHQALYQRSTFQECARCFCHWYAGLVENVCVCLCVYWIR